VADLLSTAGVNRILTMDLHAPQIQGFFDIPVDHLYGSALFIEHVKQIDIPNLVVVAPDVGATKRARAYASRLNCDLAMIDKRRPRPNEAEVVNLIGSVSGKNVLLIDDMVDTAGTLVNGAAALRKSGALQIWAAGTHALLSGPAYDKIEESEISKLLVTDTIPLTRQSDRIEVLGVATYFADAIRRICVDDSVSTLFVE
jgi:ribose-phosphate pyrophosphokinase